MDILNSKVERHTTQSYTDGREDLFKLPEHDRGVPRLMMLPLALACLLVFCV